MDESCDATSEAASSKRYVLCKMPPDWTTLPVHAGPQSPSSSGSIAVYKRNRTNKNLVYEGFICPTAPEKVPMSAMLPPPREERFGQKYARLREKIIAEEARAEARAEIIAENQRNRAADSSAITKPGISVDEVQPNTVPGCEGTADEQEQETEAEAEATCESKNKPEHLNLSNTDYPLPHEILDRRECLVPVPPEGEFGFCFEPWENTVDCFYFESGSRVQQFSPARPADMCTPPEVGDSPKMYMNLD